MQIPIIVVADEGGRFISAIESQRGPVSVVRHVHDMGEMLGIAQSGIARAVLVVTQSQELTQSLVSSLHQLELAVCVVSDQHTPPTLSGVTHIDSLADTQDIINGIEQSVRGLQSQGSLTGQRGATHENAEQLSGLTSVENLISEVETKPSGKLLTIWGPLGAPGKTMLAINLAAAYADAGYNTCLVDADTYGASAGAALGLTDDYSTLAQLCHQAEKGLLSKTDCDELSQTVRHKDSYFDIITGLNRADRWAEVRKTGLSKVYDTLKREYDVVIADTAFCIEEDEALSFDAIAPQRNDATITSLQQADGIVLVGLADVVGVPRLIKAYDQLTDTVQSEELPMSITIVFNRVRAESVGPSTQIALEHSWERFGPEHPIDLLISEDAVTADKSRLLGKTVLESDPLSSLAQDLLRLQKITSEALHLESRTKSRKDDGDIKNMVEKKRISFRFPKGRKRSSA